MRTIYSILLISISFCLQGQDAYHQDLLQGLEQDYGITNPEFLFTSSETGNINSRYNYGSATVQVEDIANLSFSKLTTINVANPTNNPWDTGLGSFNQKTIDDGDIVLVTFYARRNSSDSEIFVFAEDSNNFEKEYFISMGLTPDWTQYFIAFEASKTYQNNRMAIGFHFGSKTQNIEIGGFTAMNFKKQYPIEQVPSSFATFGYEGMEEDAQWREEANTRIATHRMANLNINVTDMNGDAIQGATVEVEQLTHDFEFGTAVVTSRFPGNNAHLPIYIEKMLDLDGKGHGFNAAVTENALKWDGWEEEWISSPTETANAIQWLADRNITTRGHTLIWPGFQYMPDDIRDNQNDLEYLRNRINGRIETMLSHPVIGEYVTEWDILNEIAVNRDLEGAFQNDPNYDTGREVYEEILSKVREIKPNTDIYINDYVVLSGGGAGSNVVNRYRQFLDELNANPTEFDGIGFQAHIGAQPTSIIKVLDVLQDFNTTYDKRVKITEFDMNELIDASVEKRYMEDFLIAAFSLDFVDAFFMWGFWDGNHWKQNAPMFDINWNLKPAGEGFIQKVFNDWWTEEMKQTDNGTATIRAFKGTHKIRVSYNGQEEILEVNLDEDQNINIQLDDVVAINEYLDSAFTISPNPVIEDQILIKFPSDIKEVSAILYANDGKEVKRISNVNNGEPINIDLLSGVYYIKLNTEQGLVTKKLIVK